MGNILTQEQLDFICEKMKEYGMIQYHKDFGFVQEGVKSDGEEHEVLLKFYGLSGFHNQQNPLLFSITLIQCSDNRLQWYTCNLKDELGGDSNERVHYALSHEVNDIDLNGLDTFVYGSIEKSVEQLSSKLSK